MKSPSRQDTLHGIALAIINKRYSTSSFIGLIVSYLIISFIFFRYSLEIANTFLIIAIFAFFTYSIMNIGKIHIINYIIEYLPIPNYLVEKLISDMTNLSKEEERKKLFDEHFPQIIEECTTCLHRTQIVEVVILIASFLLFFLFFPVASWFYLCRLNGLGSASCMDPINQVYYNLLVMTTLGVSDAWKAEWKPHEAGFNVFVMIEAVSMITYTIGYASVSAINLLSIRPQILREELKVHIENAVKLKIQSNENSP